ncbi:MAG: VOC family protein, partial [Acidithiobacillales bacterium]
MTIKPAPIPPGFEGATPYLYIRGAAKALDFYQRAFGARVEVRMDGPDGKVGHAEISVGKARVMLADEHPEMNALSPETIGGTAASFLIYVPDVDAVFQQAVKAGAKPLRPVEDKFYGDRSGMILDPFGHQWALATHIEDVSPEEMKRRMAA